MNKNKNFLERIYVYLTCIYAIFIRPCMTVKYYLLCQNVCSKTKTKALSLANPKTATTTGQKFIYTKRKQ